jgi:DNA-binding CsgD family transcriptional regulator
MATRNPPRKLRKAPGWSRQQTAGSIQPGEGSAAQFIIAGQELVVFSFPVSAPRARWNLTPAELHVTRLILEGCSNAQIASIRRTSLRTTANQIASIFRKCHVSGRAELAAALLPAKNAVG